MATITSANNFDVVACGKNLIDASKFPSSTTNNGIAFINNGDGSFSVSGTSTTNVSLSLGSSLAHLKDLFNAGFTGCLSLKNAIYHVTTCNIAITYQNELGVIRYILSNGSTVTVTPGSQLIGMTFYIASGVTVNLNNVFIQLELDTTSTPYEPYKGSNKITISSELKSLPNGVKDTIEYIGNGKGKLVQRIGREVFDGSEDEAWGSSSPLTKTTRYRISRAGVKDEETINVISDMFRGGINPVEWNKDEELIEQDASKISIRVNNSRLLTQDVAGFKAFLQINPVTVLYELETPIETIVEEPSTLTSYKGVTNVFTTANPQVEITANFMSRLKNTYEVLLDKIEKLTNAIIQLGGTV